MGFSLSAIRPALIASAMLALASLGLTAPVHAAIGVADLKNIRVFDGTGASVMTPTFSTAAPTSTRYTAVTQATGSGNFQFTLSVEVFTSGENSCSNGATVNIGGIQSASGVTSTFSFTPNSSGAPEWHLRRLGIHPHNASGTG